MNDAIVAQVPHFDEAVRAASGYPFRVRTLPYRIDLLVVLSERGDTLLLPLVPDADLGVRATREERRIVDRRAERGAGSLVTSECSNFFLLLDIPRHSHTALCTCE